MKTLSSLQSLEDMPGDRWVIALIRMIQIEGDEMSLIQAVEQMEEEIAHLKDELCKANKYLRKSTGELSRLEALVAKALEDTKRLDWLISKGAYVSHSYDGDTCNVWFSYDPEDEHNGTVPVEGYPQKVYIDPRTAIDSVMASELRAKG